MRNARRTQIQMISLFLALLFCSMEFLTNAECQQNSHFAVLSEDSNLQATSLSAYPVDINATQNANATETTQDSIDLESLGKVSHPQILTTPAPEIKMTTSSPAPNYANSSTATEKEMIQTTFKPQQTESPKPTAKPPNEPIATSNQIAYSTPNWPWPSPAAVPTNSKQMLFQEIKVSALIVAIILIASIVIIKRQKNN